MDMTIGNCLKVSRKKYIKKQRSAFMKKKGLKDRLLSNKDLQSISRAGKGRVDE